VLRRGTVLALTIAVFQLSTTHVGAGASPGSADPVLRLKVATFDPLREQPPLPESLRLSDEPTVGYFVVQFEHAVTSRTLGNLRRFGGEPLEYLPDHAFVVRLSVETAASVRSLPEVHWVGPLQPGWKISPDIGVRPYDDPSRRAGNLIYATADLFPGEDVDAVIEAAEDIGVEIIQLIRFPGTQRLKLRARLDQLHGIARIPAVAWIEELAEVEERNNTTRWVIQTNAPGSTTVWDHGLRGENQIIGHIDNLLDLNSCYFSDPVDNTPGPNHRKVVAYRSSSGPGSSFHGTHTAGIAVGDQSPINPTIHENGNAYAARISHSNVLDVSGSGAQPSNLYGFLSDAHADGARVHTNSWGDSGTAEYTTWCVDIDQFSYDFEESLVLFAVTNGLVVKSPENAKNALAVGASENGSSSDNFCDGGQGPTADGRRKPEIFAPGCVIDSAANDFECFTRDSSGTSMAAPAVAAAGALIRQYLVEGWYPTGTPQAEEGFTPTAALLKAMLLNASVDMSGIAGYPTDQEGWGRVLLENVLFFPGDTRSTSILADVRNAGGLAGGQQDSKTLTVEDSGEVLKLTLVFTEPPAALMAAAATVNDLDLELISPSGASTYLGNVFDTNAGVSITGGSRDVKNNVEMIVVDSPAVGDWTVVVKGATVNEGLQGYALVASGEVKPFNFGRLSYADHAVDDSGPLGNSDGVVDPGETVILPLTLRNTGTVLRSAISAQLRHDGGTQIRLTDAAADFPDLGPESNGQTLAPHYRFTVAPDTPCGTVAQFTASAASLQSQNETSFTLEIGNNHRDIDAPGLPSSIPKKSGIGVTSSNDVVEAFVIEDVHVSLEIAHQDIGELTVELSSPSGTSVTLHDRSSPNTADLATTYDRERQPDGPGTMADFDGEQAQGIWTLLVVDDQGGPTPAGSLVSWTLELDATVSLDCSPLDCGGDPVPGEAQGLTLARESGTDLRVSWAPVAGASGYRVWKSASPGFDSEELVGTTSQTTLLDAGALSDGLDGYYRVHAINSCEWEGP